MSDASGAMGAFGERVVNRLPTNIREEISPDACSAIKHAAAETRATDWSQVHPLDIRYSVPWFSRRYYIRLLAGPERRPIVRVLKDRRRGRYRTLVNILLIGLMAAVFYTLAAAAVLLASSALS